MNDKTGGSRGPWRLRALTVGAAVAVLTAACGVHVHFGSSGAPASTESGTYQEDFAYAHCMRSHGLPNFPLPNPSRSSSFSGQVTANGNSPVALANDACKHRLPVASAAASATTSLPGAVAADCLTLSSPCYTPGQLRAAYGIQPLLDRGITGRAQTIVLLEFPAPATGSPPAGAGDGDTHTGMALDFSDGGQDHFIGASGASAAAPLWAAVIALADQYAGRHLGFVNPALYQIARSAHYHQAFHDVTTGTNTVTFATQAITGYQAAPGWDPVTGWGSPNAQVLVPLLARYVSP